MISKRHLEIQNRVVRDFVKQALDAGFWIYESGSKHWRTPEEFISDYLEKRLFLKDDFQTRYRIMNPRSGLAAADVMVKKLVEKRTAFENKILDYYMNRDKL